MLREKIYNGTDNEIVLGVFIDGNEWSPATLTRIVISLIDDDANEIVIDSDNSSNAFDWTQQGDVLDNVINVLTLKLGDEEIPVRDDYVATFTLYEPSFANGIVWDDTISIEVI